MILLWMWKRTVNSQLDPYRFILCSFVLNFCFFQMALRGQKGETVRQSNPHPEAFSLIMEALPRPGLQLC